MRPQDPHDGASFTAQAAGAPLRCVHPSACRTQRTRQSLDPGVANSQDSVLISGTMSEANGLGLSQSLERGLAVLCAFTPDRPMLGISDLARELDLTRSTAHRCAATLAALGFLEQDASTRKYRLGASVLDPGQSHQVRHAAAASTAPRLCRLKQRPLPQPARQPGSRRNESGCPRRRGATAAPGSPRSEWLMAATRVRQALGVRNAGPSRTRGGASRRRWPQPQPHREKESLRRVIESLNYRYRWGQEGPHCGVSGRTSAAETAAGRGHPGATSTRRVPS